MRVYELAKQLVLTNEQILMILQEFGQNVKSHMKKLSNEQIEMVRNYASSSTDIKSDVVKKDVDKKLVTFYGCFKDGDLGHMGFTIDIDVNKEKHRLKPLFDEHVKYRSKISLRVVDKFDKAINHDKDD